MIKEIQRTIYVTSDGREFAQREGAKIHEFELMLTQFLADRQDQNSQFIDDDDLMIAAKTILNNWNELVEIMRKYNSND